MSEVEQEGKPATAQGAKPSKEMKEKAITLLREGKSIDYVVKETNIGVVTIKKYASKIKAEKTSTEEEQSSSSIPSEIKSLKALKAGIIAEKVKLQDLLNGGIQRQIDDISEKEKAIDEVIKLYKI